MVASTRSKGAATTGTLTLPVRYETEVRLVTPDMARQYLSNMGPQRNIRPSKIKQYADDMRDGNWLFNGAPLVFDGNGRMRDGQNRMHALVEANVTLPFMCLLNASEETISTIDTGMARTFADVTQMQGIPNASGTAATASLWWKYENEFFAKSGRPTHKQLESTRDKHLNSIYEAIKMANRYPTAKRLCGGSALMFVLGYIWEKKPELAEEFANAIEFGLNLTEDDPVFALRRTLTNNLGRRAKLHPHVITALLIKTFNFRYQGRSVQNVMWRSGEKFPKFAI